MNCASSRTYKPIGSLPILCLRDVDATYCGVHMSKLQRLQDVREVLIGTGLAVLTCVMLVLLPVEWARAVIAHLLTLIAATYVGFALASNGHLSLARQIAGCSVFVACALLGSLVNWWFLAVGLALHGGWDYWHHGEGGGGVIPHWYVPFCAVYDWMVGLFVAVHYASVN